MHTKGLKMKNNKLPTLWRGKNDNDDDLIDIEDVDTSESGCDGCYAENIAILALAVSLTIVITSFIYK
jgi:hypothetical protein